jgi:hypothetical protein
MLPASTCMGQLVDVSIGGLTFQYIEHEGSGRDRAETHVLIGDDSVYLDRILSTIIEDVPVYERPSLDIPGIIRRSARRVWQRRVQFKGLTRDQKAQLEYFLRYRTEGRACKDPIEKVQTAMPPAALPGAKLLPDFKKWV